MDKDLGPGEGAEFSDGFYEEAVRILCDYIRIPTLNPPGEDREGVRFLAAILRDRGLAPEIIATAPDRGALVCTIPGRNPSLRPIVLAGHVDVVPAEAAEWSVPPFSGEIRDGFIWGRGALDMKGMGVMQLMAFLAVQQRQLPLERGVTYLALPDEETAGAKGAKVIAARYLDRLAPELMINEGGYGLRNMMFNGVVFPVVVAEKLSMRVRLSTRGPSGHSNQPGRDLALDRLLKGLAAVQQLKYPMTVHPVVKETLCRLAAKKRFPESFLLRHASWPFIRSILNGAFEKDQTLNAMTRHTICMTVVRAGNVPNAYPGSAEAILDIRILPQADPMRLVEDIRRKVEPHGVALEITSHPVPAEPTDFNTPAFAIIEKALLEEVPGALVVPLLDVGGTDSKHFRPHGIPCYDIIPIIIEAADLKRIHGADERLSIDNLKLGIRILYKIVCRLCSVDRLSFSTEAPRRRTHGGGLNRLKGN